MGFAAVEAAKRLLATFGAADVVSFWSSVQPSCVPFFKLPPTQSQLCGITEAALS